MLSTSFDHSWAERLTLLKLWGYRIGVYTAIAVLDDPAWLALMFC
jgi:hypothetical protein